MTTTTNTETTTATTSTKAAKKRFSPVAIGSALAVAFFIGLMMYALRHDPNALPSQLVGQQAPVFKADLAQGGTFDFSQEVGKGRWVVLNFWSTTCIVCREEAPQLESFYETVASKGPPGPMFVSVNIQEQTRDILGYERDFRLTYPVVKDLSGRISLDYGVYGTPETFFIDPRGTVRHRVAGEVDKDSILRFIDWLEKNPNVGAQEAMKGFTLVRSGVGG